MRSPSTRGERETIALPAGEVTLDDRRTRRRWTVELAPYAIAAEPVTQAHYAVYGEDRVLRRRGLERS